MPFSFAARPREDHCVRPIGAPEPRFYPTEFLPAMQGLLAAVADAQTRYEIEREQIEQGPGSEKDKQRRLAELRAVHEHRCGLQADYVELAEARIEGWAKAKRASGLG
jgi:hypothetical protein